jgi:hypothetical protein
MDRLSASVIAQSYVDAFLPGRKIHKIDLCEFDENFCREVGAWYDRVPVVPDPRIDEVYALFGRETRAQYEAICAAGFRIRPWVDQSRPQPYSTSTEMCDSVERTGELFVYLTAKGHGNSPAAPSYHPIRAPSGVEIDGVPFCYNDLFRGVHDFFGHFLHRNTFGPRGEFRATRDHMQMYSEAVYPVLAAETIAQICWFFHGPHLNGRDDPPPARRPFSEQKPVLFPQEYIKQYLALFERASL